MRILEPQPKSGFHQISTGNACSHYWETGCPNFVKVKVKCKQLIENINSSELKKYGAYLHVKSTCAKRIWTAC